MQDLSVSMHWHIYHERNESTENGSKTAPGHFYHAFCEKMGSIATSEAILVVEVQRLQCSSHLIVVARLVVHINMLCMIVHYRVC